MSKLFYITALLLGSSLATNVHANTNNEYLIQYSAQSPVIDGNPSDKAWDEANTLTQFSFPWRTQLAPATEFKALWNEDGLFFRYRISDKNIAIGIDPKRAILDSDRVEIFLAKDEQLTTYYTMEIDPKARVFSAKASYDSQHKKIGHLDSTWIWPGLETQAATVDGGYIVETKIPVTTLTSLGLWQDEQQTALRCALMRAEFTKQADGKLDMGWMTWIDPNTLKPNFHNPYTFGLCKLIK
ncbi:CBM9 family sugar-binding protein [Vibrio alfacsensis]|uniref:CBM9 family sugar-binding protein n=1 Tax=Vibrio TaxID=662 RepID=UPI004068BB0E